MGAISSNLPINENKDAAWDARGAMNRYKEVCMDDEGNMDWGKFKKMFLWMDPEKPDMMGGFKLPFADVTDGKLKAVFKGVSAAMAALNGARGGVDMPDSDKTAVYNQIKKYYAKFGEEVPELKSMSDDEVKHKDGESIILHAGFVPDKTKDLGDGIIEATITTGTLDHHGEQINVDGVDTSQYHGTVLYGHDYMGLPIGKTIDLVKMKSKIKAKFKLFIDVYPFANTVYEIIKAGGLTDVSIGGLVRKWNENYTVIEELVMKEFSVVPIGANPEAMITAIKKLNLDVKDVKAQYQDFAKSVLLDKVNDLGQDEINDAVRVLKNLTATLEEAAKAATSHRANEPTEVKRIKHITLRDSAKAVATQSERVIKTIKLKNRGKNHE